MPTAPPSDRKLARQKIVLAVLSNVISNVPVKHCAIIKAVKRAKDSSSKFTEGELLLLAFVKIPCAIDYLVQILPVAKALRDRDAWLVAVQLAITHFKADCCIKDNNLNEMHPTYRQQRTKVANSIETTTGLLYMRKQLISKLTTADHFLSCTAGASRLGNTDHRATGQVHYQSPHLPWRYNVQENAQHPQSGYCPWQVCSYQGGFQQAHVPQDVQVP